MATHSGILAWETPWTEEPGITGYSGGGYSPGGCKESDATQQLNNKKIKIKKVLEEDQFSFTSRDFQEV